MRTVQIRKFRADDYLVVDAYGFVIESRIYVNSIIVVEVVCVSINLFLFLNGC